MVPLYCKILQFGAPTPHAPVRNEVGGGYGLMIPFLKPKNDIDKDSVDRTSSMQIKLIVIPNRPYPYDVIA